MTEEGRLLDISNRYHSEEEYLDAGEDVGFLLSVIKRRDRQNEILTETVEEYAKAEGLVGNLARTAIEKVKAIK